MKKTLLVSTFLKAIVMSSAVSAQTVQLPTSLSSIGDFNTPVVVIPSDAATLLPIQTSGIESNSALTISVNTTSLDSIASDFPGFQTDLIDAVSLTAFIDPSTALDESASVSDAATVDLPSIGTASFLGVASGSVTSASGTSALNGDVTIEVDFASGAVESAFTNMTSQPVAAEGLEISFNQSEWRDFTSSGSLDAETALFSGAATTDDGLLSGTVDGVINGTIGASGDWSLAGAGEFAEGTFGAVTQ